MGNLRRAWAARQDPLVTTREYDIASLLTWFFYAGWGLFTMFSDLSVFSNLGSYEQVYPQLWGGAVGFMALTSSAAAATTFFLEPSHIQSRIRAKRAEIIALSSLLGLILVYPITLVFSGDPQGNFRPEILSLSLSYFPFAVFRVRHLLARIRSLYVMSAIGGE